MRITNNMISSNLLINLNNNLNAMNRFNNQISTGKVISRPSDDPVIASKALKLRTDLSELEQYGKNSNDALSWIDITESAIKEFNSVLSRMRELTIGAANGDKTIEDNQKIAEEIKQLKEQLISIGNTTYAGRSIFTGFQTNKELFDDEGNYLVNVTSEYINNRKYTYYEVGINEEIRVNTYGIDLFGYVDNNESLEKFPTGEATGEKATGGSLIAQTEFDFTQSFHELTDETIEISIEGDVFTVPTLELKKINGETTEKKDIINILSNAKNASGGALKYSADIYFDNDKLVISSRKAYGETSEVSIEYKGTDRNLVEDVLGLDDSIGVGDPAKPPIIKSKYPVDLNADYSTTIDNETITIKVGTTDFTITAAELKTLSAPMDGIALANFIGTTAKDSSSNSLNGEANVTFDGERIVISSLSEGASETIQVTYAGNDTSVLEDSLYFETSVVNGSDATSGKLTATSQIDLSDSNLLSDEVMTINFGATAYTISASEILGPPALDETGIASLINTKVNALGSATLLDGKIEISSNSVGTANPITVSYSGTDPSIMEGVMGLSDGINLGTDAVDAVLTTDVLVTDADASVAHPDDDTKSIYSGQRMFVHLGTERKEIILDDIPLPATTADVVSAMQNKIDTAFGAGKIIVNGDNTNNISFSTQNNNDGTIPELFVDYERSTESQLFTDINEVLDAMGNGDFDTIEKFIGKMDKHLANTHAVWSDVGARYNRIELINNRIATNEVTYTKLLSLNEDVDQSEAIMNFKNQENVYRASLSMGSKIIQPSLVDFIK